MRKLSIMLVLLVFALVMAKMGNHGFVDGR